MPISYLLLLLWVMVLGGSTMLLSNRRTRWLGVFAVAVSVMTAISALVGARMGVAAGAASAHVLTYLTVEDVFTTLGAFAGFVSGAMFGAVAAFLITLMVYMRIRRANSGAGQANGSEALAGFRRPRRF